MLTINFTLKELIHIKAELNFISGLLINKSTYADSSVENLMEIVDKKIETILDCANEVDEDNF